MVDIVEDICEILVSGISQLGAGIGAGFKATMEALFLTSHTTGTGDAAVTTYSLSSAGGVIVVFAAIGLAVGLTTLVVKWIMSLGARN